MGPASVPAARIGGILSEDSIRTDHKGWKCRACLSSEGRFPYGLQTNTSVPGRQRHRPVPLSVAPDVGGTAGATVKPRACVLAPFFFHA